MRMGYIYVKKLGRYPLCLDKGHISMFTFKIQNIDFR
ncbi:Uncharacterised protein [Serratia marcescens]|uniref:Uncharacterized protein n=1 Tax=Serratia marcescens TaxID=615 RepID=A0A1C3HG85_SERMA|nr:hypothetical protein SM14VA7_25790 [Serratia marcescens]CAI1649909.1 Uncharacterised protein [Serratia marcescens]SAY44060.1 Uncharacterised protein [Serratia marcescens]